MKRIYLSLGPDREPSRIAAVAVWTLCGGLLVALLMEVSLGRSLDEQLGSLNPRAGSEGTASRAPSASELNRVELLRNHATVRFADWAGAFADLGGALPAGASVERLSLNARTGKGEAVVRMKTVADAAKVAETMARRDAVRVPAVRRCDQAAVSDQLPVRCELEVNWRKADR